jgi:hypothetical protein
VLIVGGDLDPLVPAFIGAAAFFRRRLTEGTVAGFPRAHHDDFTQIAGPEYRNRVTGFFDVRCSKVHAAI